ncbi:MAG: hypothetical protein HY566_00670, partial [Candidatus Kerfeldbacteria bacterium]|nr:hypothetical protein [Candidatus Kerfeldbacteria bacterium]
GSAQSYTVTVTSINGFASPVTLVVAGMHASMTGSFVTNPLPIVGPTATTTMTVTTQSPATPCGGPAYNLTVTGTSGALSHTAGTALTVNCVLFPDFSLAGTPTSVTVTQGTPAVFDITATSVDGYINTVLLSCIAIGGCSFADASLDVNPAPPPDTTTLTIDTTSLAIGSHPFQVQGSDGALTHTVGLTVNVLAPPIPEDFAFDVTPNSVTLTEGDTGTFTVSVTPSGGFSQSVAVTWVSAPPLPATITLTPDPLTMNPGTQTLQVQTSAGSAGTYTLDFTANSTTSTGVPLVKQKNGVQIFVNAPAPACGGGCPAGETCTPGGCVADSPADGRCNESLCYDSSGRFREPAPPGCWASWQPCNNFNVLKVRKDRQCNQWLDCVSSTSAVNIATGKTQNMCSVLGVCDQLGPDGQCTHYVSSSAAGQNQEFATPGDVTGVNSKIRWYSGYSSGFHFKELVQEIGGTIAATYPPQDIKETGLNGAQSKDLVRNGDFEEMRCYGGKRDGLACITTSDCRVDQGVCADTSSPTPVSIVSPNPCDSDADCADVKSRDGATNLNSCRYLSSWGAEVDCKNPEESRWLGVTPPSADVNDNYEEAGFGGTETSTSTRENSVRIGQRLNEANTSSMLRWKIWEADENFEDQTSKFEAGRSPRYPEYSFFKHLKDGNNILRIELDQQAPKFSGIGVPVADQDSPLIEGGNGYVVSFKFKYGDTGGRVSTIKAQLAFNYSRSEFGGYESYENGPNRAEYLDFGEIRDATTEWKEYVFGPVVIEPTLNYERSKAVFLNFVTASDPVPTTFFLDDVSLKPALNTATVDNPNPTLPAHARLVKLPRSCRLYPKGDAPGCEYRDAGGTNYKGWRGYCLDKDPKNENLCLTWWPLDVLAGESLFGAQRQQGYTGRYPLFMCPEQEGGPSVLDTGNIEVWGFENEMRIAVDTLTTGNNVCYGTDGSGMGSCGDIPGARGRIRWRDIEQIDVFAHFGDYEGAGWDSCGEDYFCAVGGSTNAAKCSCNKEAHYWRLPLDHINPRDGDDGVKLTFTRYGSSLADIDNTAFFTPNRWNGGCSGTGDDQWLQALVRFAHPTDPNHHDAVVDGLFLKVCDDYPQGVWPGGGSNRGQVFRVIVRAKQSCNYLVQTVRSDNGPVEQAWATRLKPLSQYGLPDYVSPANPRPYEPNARYSNDAAPFGAVRAPANGIPSNWGTWTPNDQGAQTRPSSFDFREPDSIGNVPRAGTPFSTRWPVPAKPKYCFVPIDYNAVQPSYNDYYGNGLTTKENNSCSTKAEIDACQSQNGICVGAPIGRCSLKPTISCSVDADCKSTTPVYDYGTCSIYTPSDPEKLRVNSANPSGDIAGIRAPLRRIRDIFARSYGCWQYHTELVDNAPGKQLVSRYRQVPLADGSLGCKLDYVDSAGTWQQADWRDWNLGDPNSFMDPFSSTHPQQCTGNTRPGLYSPTAHCYVKPEIGTPEKPPTIGGAQSGTITIPQEKAITAEFSYRVDADQGPAEEFKITWGGESCDASPAPPFIDYDKWEDVPAGNAILKRIARYPDTGTFRPKICVRDHWGVIGEYT